MTQSTHQFTSLADFAAEMQRLEAVIAATTNHSDRDAAYDDLEKVETALAKFRAEKRKSNMKGRLEEEWTELTAIAKAKRYPSIDDMLEAHGFVRKAFVTEPVTKARRTPKKAGEPAVYKYLLKDEFVGQSGKDGKPLAPGYGRNVDAVKNTDYYRDASKEELAKMEAERADWQAKNPK